MKNAPKKWLPAEDRLLLEMRRRDWHFSAMAQRFDCTIDEVLNRLEKIEIPQFKSEEDSNAQTLLTPQQHQELAAQLPVFQRSFLDLAQAFEQQGKSIEAMAHALNARLELPELETLLEEIYQLPRHPGESVYQWIARHLSDRMTIIPHRIPTVDLNEKAVYTVRMGYNSLPNHEITLDVTIVPSNNETDTLRQLREECAKQGHFGTINHYAKRPT